MSKIIFGGHKVTAQADYSTTETKTGEYWIDGKPIYRMVATSTLPTVATEGVGVEATKQVATGVETIIKSYGYYTHGGSMYSLPYIFQGSGAYSVSYMNYTAVVDGSNNAIIATQSNRTYANGDTVTVTIEYTKTTD